MIILICGVKEGGGRGMISFEVQERKWHREGEDGERERMGTGGVQMKTMHGYMGGWVERRRIGGDWDVGLDYLLNAMAEK